MLLLSFFFFFFASSPMELDEALTRKQYVFLAKVAEEAERYGEMAGYMEKITRTPSFGDFTEDERSLFAVAYNNFICSRRKAWKVVFSAENKEEGQRNTAIAALIKAYRARIEDEISSICGEVFGLLNSHLIPSASSAESKVLYLKIKGDFHRYLAEFKVGEERKQAAIDAAAAYHAARGIAHVNVRPPHPIRLGLELNFSVFFYEIMNSIDKACSIGNEAIEAALRDLYNLSPRLYTESVFVMQLIRDNLTIWTVESQQQQQQRMVE